MEYINRNIIIGKAGGTAGKNSVNYKISLPAEMMQDMGITPENKGVRLAYKNKKIIIEKA